MNSPIKWMGGKYRLRKTIVKMLPEHICYCEPFGGAGWVLFEKQPSEIEIYNDINCELVNFFRIVKEKPEEFVRKLNSLLIARETFQRLKYLDIGIMSEIDRAVRFYYLIHFSFGAKMKDFLISPTRKPPRILEQVEESITHVRGRLINTIIENRDFEKLIKRL